MAMQDRRVEWIGPRISLLLGLQGALIDDLLRSAGATQCLEGFLNAGTLNFWRSCCGYLCVGVSC